jgi:hypothetical protein
MKIIPIFVPNLNCSLWSVCYPEDGGRRDIFSILMDEKWSNVAYLMDFFVRYESYLNNTFWGGLSIDEAINKIEEERLLLDQELYDIETGESKNKRDIREVFQKLHNNIFSINFRNEAHRKAKPDVNKPMIRIYGIELEDGTIIITGGALKLTQTMEGEEFEVEMKKLKSVQEYLTINGIINRQGLID